MPVATSTRLPGRRGSNPDGRRCSGDVLLADLAESLAPAVHTSTAELSECTGVRRWSSRPYRTSLSHIIGRTPQYLVPAG